MAQKGLKMEQKLDVDQKETQDNHRFLKGKNAADIVSAYIDLQSFNHL